MWKGAADIFNDIDTKINISPTIKITGISPWLDIKLDISGKLRVPTIPYIILVPNKKIQVDKLPITKYFTPASEELKSSLENDTKIYKAKLCNSMETNKDNKLLEEIINIIPITEINITSGNSVLSRDLSFFTLR